MSAVCSYVGHHDPLAGLHVARDLHRPGSVIERAERHRHELVDPVCVDGLDRVAAAGERQRRVDRDDQRVLDRALVISTVTGA